MKNNSVSSNSKGFAGWIEDFITGLAKKEASLNNEPEKEEKDEEVLATIHLDDLDKVVWKEESFGVHFDEKGASLINEFGNVVRTLQDCKTIEEVDKQLNGGEIVAEISEEDAEDELKEELNKIADALWEENDGMTNITPEHVEAPQTGEVPTDGTQTQDQPVTASVEEETEEKETDGDQVISAIADGFEQLETTIASMSKRLALVEQQYARNPLFQDTTDTSAEDEIKHFTETADETNKEIEHEHNTDITSPAGRVELSVHKNETSEIEDIVTQDATVIEAPVETETETETEEVVDEKTETDVPTEEETETETEEKEEVKTASEIVDEDIEDEDEPAVEKLAGAAEKIFQKGICPETGEELIKSKQVGNYLGIYSTAGTEYAVDLKTGSIYKYLK